jgi:hypothetical protein|tara:strand:+ start:919 stop:1104 length:186 start_codon:yes stop_codon:yes gene_type:complete
MADVVWILLILNTVLGIDEIKVTHWDTYKTQNECLLERAVLTVTFTQGEKAVCVEEERIIE